MKKVKKNNKKKLLIIFLFLFALAGVVGYGVYSYYYTQGEVTSNSDSIEVLSFDPEIYIDGNTSFLGSGGSVELNCPSSTRGGETLTCTGEVTVYNNGDTAFNVEIEDASASESHNGYIETSVGDPEFSWDYTYLEEGDYATLSISVPVTISGGGASSEPVEVSDAVNGGDVTVTANFKIKATQVHD